METTAIVLIMLLAVVVSRALSHLTRLPAPLVQIALGAAIFYSSLGSVALDPEVFFVLLLPPLLFLDGWRIPKDAMFRDAPTILTLALGLVVFTVLGLGLLIHWMIPAMPLPIAFALAAVISPTDPVGVSTITARNPLPARMRHILEGESLFNDASGLVCMRFAVAAALTGSFSLWSALASFVWVAAGGLAIGTALTWLVIQLHFRSRALLGDDGGAQILLTLLLPSGVYLVAEYFHCSGILAAVAAGITMAFAPHTHGHAGTRIRRTAVWDTLQFAANGAIFVLLGEQIPSIVSGAALSVREAGHLNPWWLGWYVLLIVVALVALRFAWVWVTMRVTWFGARLRGSTAPESYARLVAAMSLAGVRGAITLAGVLTLPLKLADGSPLPGRDLAIFLAAGVIVVWLVLASIGMPHLLSGLKLPPDPTHWAQESRAKAAAAAAAMRAIESAPRPDDAQHPDTALHVDAATRILQIYQHRLDQHADHGATPRRGGKADAIERKLRLLALRAERDEVLRLGSTQELAEVTLRKLVREIDLQEARHGS